MVFKSFAKESLEYHTAQNDRDRNGKIGIEVTKRCNSEEDFSMAYLPGVVYPALEIAKDSSRIYDYTNKGNFIAIISNGSSVLDLGDIGAQAVKPILEGKSVLLKKLVDIDAIDIEIDSEDIETIATTITSIANSFGAINLDGFKATDCFEIEKRLKENLKTPVFYDGLYVDAVVTTAALLNYMEFASKRADEITVVIVGANTSAISSARLYKRFGIQKLYLFDEQGLVNKERDDIASYLEEFAVDSAATLKDVLEGASVLFVAEDYGIEFDDSMVMSMGELPLIIGVSNPLPDFLPDRIRDIRPEVIVATNERNSPNYIDKLLVFPSILRAILDVRATQITESMIIEATKALAALAREEVPPYVRRVLKDDDISFGSEYIIPSIYDRRVMLYVATAVADRAVRDGVTQTRSFIRERYEKYIKEISENLC